MHLKKNPAKKDNKYPLNIWEYFILKEIITPRIKEKAIKLVNIKVHVISVVIIMSLNIDTIFIELLLLLCFVRNN